jgi:hypothetical protein
VIDFCAVEEQHLIGFGHRIVAVEVAHVDAAVRENQVRGVRVLFIALMSAFATADNVPDREGLRIQ